MENPDDNAWVGLDDKAFLDIEDPSNDVWTGLDDGVFLNINTGNEEVKEIYLADRCKRQKGTPVEGTLSTRSISPIRDPTNRFASSQVSEGKKSEEQDDAPVVQRNEDQMAGTSSVTSNLLHGTARGKEKVVPIHHFRKGYVRVSDFVALAWCEKRFEYTITNPTRIPKPEHITAGTNLHLLRELEIQDCGQLKITYTEDNFAMKVMIYKLLFDDLIRGHTLKHTFVKTLGLNIEKSLDICVVSYIKDNQALFSKEHYSREDWNLSILLDEMKTVAALFPFVQDCYIDYVWQNDLKTFYLYEVEYDEKWLFKKMDGYLEYWLGHRSAQGVDVEEAWKCHTCNYQKDCSWVAAKISERKHNMVPK
ncbi:exonuclease V-like isoform X2 [Oratosquilla oratoria]|uniref:exonuclease V-like isoform X2 n=1 Tax=Oratosquilla oratoria TaxID=337810 RepID=UPI003F77431B